MRLSIDTKHATSSIRIGFTDQRLTAHGGMIVWSHFLQQKRFRHQLRAVLPHTPTSPNAYDPTDVALGYVGGILCGAALGAACSCFGHLFLTHPRKSDYPALN